MLGKHNLYLILTLCSAQICLCLLIGCSFLGLKKEKPFVKSFPYPGPPEKIWPVVKKVLASYRIKPIDYAKGTMETEWNTVLGVFRYESTRRKVHIQLVPLEAESLTGRQDSKTSLTESVPSDPPGEPKQSPLRRPGEEARYVVKVWVEVQHNVNLVPDEQPELLEWKPAGSDADEAARIIMGLNLRLLDREALERYYNEQQ